MEPIVASLLELVRLRRPHAIICTHFLLLNLLAREKRKGRLEAPLYAVVTDYTGHIYWMDPYAADRDGAASRGEFIK